MDVFTDQQLVLWGWSLDFLRREIAAGRLRAIDQGSGFAVTRANWDAWIAKHNPAKANGTAAGGALGPPSRQAFAPVAGDPVSRWEQLVATMQAGGMTRAQATRACVERHPDAHLAYLAAHNQRLAQADVQEQAVRATARDRARRRTAFQSSI